MINEQKRGRPAPQISRNEAAQTATEDAVDQLCWSIAQMLKRILDLGSAPDEDAGMDE